ncbi:MAG: hypothetical protein ACKOA0_16125, partial [Burkholderiaceae bacterium]
MIALRRDWRAPSSHSRIRPYTNNTDAFTSPMDPYSFSLLFAAFLIATLGTKLWLASRHIQHIQRHRDAVP